MAAVALCQRLNQGHMSRCPRVLVPSAHGTRHGTIQLITQGLHHEFGRIKVGETLAQIDTGVAQHPCKPTELAKDALGGCPRWNCRTILNRIRRFHGFIIFGQAGFWHADQACGDPPQFLCAAVDVTVDTQNGGVPLDGTVLLHLFSSRGQSSLDTGLVVHTSGAQSCLQRCNTALRQHFHEIRMLHLLLGNVGLETLHTLHVDVKHAILASCTNVLDSRERSAIEVSMYIRMFQEFTVSNHFFHHLSADKMIVHPVDFRVPGRPCSV
mmetsp:Transcript_63004/g.138041  ORF Transcript_63004/g.138041 Transcript_63004/m.138041 type:complete len:268 (-) Transcript_63004:132-935(-)